MRACRNVVHADLKCENVLLTTCQDAPSGLRAKISDFGAAAAALGCRTHGRVFARFCTAKHACVRAASARGARGEVAAAAAFTSMSAPPGGDGPVRATGLSKALRLDQTHTTTRAVGTITHMPPELLRCAPQRMPCAVRRHPGVPPPYSGPWLPAAQSAKTERVRTCAPAGPCRGGATSHA